MCCKVADKLNIVGGGGEESVAPLLSTATPCSFVLNFIASLLFLHLVFSAISRDKKFVIILCIILITNVVII